MIKAPDVTAIYVIVGFLISYVILRRFLFGPLGAILDEREREAESAARIHAESTAELEKAIAHAERELAAARREALKEREALRAEGRAHFERKFAEARASAGRAMEEGRRRIAADSARSASELPARASVLARMLAEKVLGRALAA